MELLNRSHGLSLSDQYWVKPESSDLEWDTVNFFTNLFDEELGRTLLTARSSSHRFSLNAPDASTGGDLPKRWTIAGDGTRILIKAGRTGQEPVNELIASDLCSRLGIPAVRYNLGEYDNRPVSTCPEMLTDTEELVSAWQILESVKRDNRLSARDQWIRAAQLFGCEGAAVVHATDDWLLVDYLMRNIDRHYNNFGLIRDVETLRVRPAPLFDTGASLWCGELAIDNRDYKAKPFYATYKTPTARRQPADSCASYPTGPDMTLASSMGGRNRWDTACQSRDSYLKRESRPSRPCFPPVSAKSAHWRSPPAMTAPTKRWSWVPKRE